MTMPKLKRTNYILHQSKTRLTHSRTNSLFIYEKHSEAQNHIKIIQPKAKQTTV